MSALTEGHHIGPYRIVGLLGEGGMGAVYEARQEPLDRRVALKTLHPEHARNKEAVARFFNEAKILSRLEHPSIVQVSDFGDAPDGTSYLVMEYLRGHSLGHRLRELRERGERLSVVTTLQMAFQVADVLAIAHEQGIVHRDLKPDNLMLVADAVAPGGERVKLLDFGIAKLTQANDIGAVKTDTQAVMGTPMYMSPEQCAGAGGVDAKTDVYSLGCVIYEALAGRPPFVAEGSGQLIGLHLFQAPPALSSLAPKVPVSVTELIHRLLTKDKAQRPGMSETADAIGRLLSKISGAGPALRSRSLNPTDPNATRPIPLLPAPTTLGRAAGQSQFGRSGRSSRRFAWIVGGFGLLFISSAWMLRPHGPNPKLLISTGSPLPSVPRPLAAVVPPAAEPQTVTWRIDSQPTGATIIDESGKVQGKTPFTASRTAESGKSVFRLRQSGYAEATLTIDRDQDTEQRVTLLPSQPAPAQRPSAKPSGPSAKPSTSPATRVAPRPPLPPPLKRNELPVEP